MIATPARPGRRRRRRPRLALPLIVVLIGALLFVLGVGLGRALEERDEPRDQVTRVRTLQPLPVAPARETVTVTVSGG